MAYGANPAIANGEGDFPSDLPASLLVRESCQVFFFLHCRIDLNQRVCIDVIASQQPLLCCHLDKQHCWFLMGLKYQHVKLPTLATILQVAILSYTGILTVMSSPSAYYKVEAKAPIPRSARGLTVHFPYSKWWHMHIQNYVEICRNCLPGDVTCTTLDLSLVNSSTQIIIFMAILQCIKIEIVIFNYFTN